MAKVQNRKKRKLLEQLQQMPIVEVACKRVGVPRSTYYRWRKEDPVFESQATEALAQGVDVVNDVAESKVISGVNDGEQSYVRYWLDHRHSAYKPDKIWSRRAAVEAEREEFRRESEKLSQIIRSLEDIPLEAYFEPSDDDEINESFNKLRRD